MTPELAFLIQQRRAKKRQYARTGQLQLKRECALLTKWIRYLSSTTEKLNFQKFVAQFEPNQDGNRNLFAISRLLKGKNSSIPPLADQQNILVTDRVY